MIRKEAAAAKNSNSEAPSEAEPEKKPIEARVEETPFEMLSGYCQMFVVFTFIITFLAQNYLIPSGSMEKTLLVGDHLLVDRTTLAPSASWMPLIRTREPRRDDVVVFIKPVTDPDPATGAPIYMILVKRLIGVPGDRIHLRNGVVFVNGVAQNEPFAQPTTEENHWEFLDEFPSVTPDPEPGNLIPAEWAADFPNHVVNGELVVPAGKYFMMGDNRHNSADSRFWGFVPRENIMGRPLFNYWSFASTEDELEQTGAGKSIGWVGHVALHFFSDTRWKRTLKVIR
jgi:signal peptidase I